MGHIYPVKEWTEIEKKAYKEYCEKCLTNGVTPEPFDQLYANFPYKRGYVLDGYFPIYKKRKKDFR